MTSAHTARGADRGKFVYSPRFVVNCVDTTGAGDIFHARFVTCAPGNAHAGDARFSNAMAALNCPQLGAEANRTRRSARPDDAESARNRDFATHSA